MGSLFSSKSNVVEDKTAKEAFKIAKPALQTAVSGGIDLYNQYKGSPAYAGERVAGLNPFQTGSADTLGGFTQNFTPSAQNAAGNLGFSNLIPGMSFGSNAADIFGRSTMDPTQSIINAAGQYANNPFVDGLIDASGRDITRNLFESQLPGINRAATGAGNLNSSRAGVESAIAQRGAADRFADMSSQIRSQFFGKGLDMGQNQYNQNLQNMMNSNQGLMQASQLGLQGLTGAQNIAQTGFNQGQAAGGLYQLQNQAQLDANKGYFDESLANQLALLANLQGTTQAGQGFKSAAGINTQPSVVSQVAGLVGAFTGGK
jgi:hypothetical protein